MAEQIKRNLKIKGRGINPELFSDGGGNFRDWAGLKNAIDKGVEVKNPETGNMVKIKTALGYDKDTKVYKAAQFALKKK